MTVQPLLDKEEEVKSKNSYTVTHSVMLCIFPVPLSTTSQSLVATSANNYDDDPGAFGAKWVLDKNLAMGHYNFFMSHGSNTLEWLQV